MVAHPTGRIDMLNIKPRMTSKFLIAIQGMSTCGIQVTPQYRLAGVEVGDCCLVGESCA
jgi:hypothetical protein